MPILIATIEREEERTETEPEWTKSDDRPTDDDDDDDDDDDVVVCLFYERRRS